FETGAARATGAPPQINDAQSPELASRQQGNSRQVVAKNLYYVPSDVVCGFESSGAICCGGFPSQEMQRRNISHERPVTIAEHEEMMNRE
ncbi:MAG: hypothetical protein ACYC2K_09595, partial [Gemmatimonadales bacterium]